MGRADVVQSRARKVHRAMTIWQGGSASTYVDRKDCSAASKEKNNKNKTVRLNNTSALRALGPSGGVTRRDGTWHVKKILPSEIFSALKSTRKVL
jgi:hypothetical protein